MILVLLRHGRTRANEEHLYCGCSDLPLSENGRKELELLRSSVSYPSTDGLRLLTSGMKRTNETLQLIYGKEPNAVIPGLVEMNFGRFELHSYEELKTDPEYIAWITDTGNGVSAGGGETRREFDDRVHNAIDSITEDSLIVTHGGVIACVMAYLFPDAGAGFYDWQPQCGCGYRIDTRKKEYIRIG